MYIQHSVSFDDVRDIFYISNVYIKSVTNRLGM
ncbi:hypothetical protein Sulba_1547 [Sulfurospirillum barnesii SES-3]|uniref:Uncharacterized protein n=1 Tax=Sulfurospirillum barnesii (strain ATCC 700032 / DSM 10660 / SES-3) TaxID=760154 RepID=I3XY11_SULBS|nr:hypothetical protein Sulba_1547 [Sulfurospirillum barnesii SES-3]